MSEEFLISQLLHRNVELDIMHQKIFLKNIITLDELNEETLEIVYELKQKYGYEAFYKL